jgi:hypothetical protein
LCDRGTVDGGAYWPGDPHEFFDEFDTSLASELSRYDAVIFFESAAVGGMSIEGGNPVRTENIKEAVALDDRLKKLWSQHPRFILIPHNPSFFKKITFALAALDSIVAGWKPGRRIAFEGKSRRGQSAASAAVSKRRKTARP